MANPRFLVEGCMASPGEYLLGPGESHHATSVMRVRSGDAIIVFDGQGHRAEAAVVSADRAGVRVRVDAIHEEARLTPTLAIATAIPKGKRWQVLVEKCTELGVDAIVPMLTERGVVKAEGDPEKWRRWAVEAAKQSRRSWLPEIGGPVSFADVFDSVSIPGALLLVADAGGSSPAELRDALASATKVVALVGPEGGFSEAELEECRRRGGELVSLSPFTLRIETAAAALCALVREVGL